MSFFLVLFTSKFTLGSTGFTPAYQNGGQTWQYWTWRGPRPDLGNGNESVIIPSSVSLNLFTVSGVFFLFVGAIELGYGVFVTSAPIFGAVASPGLLGFLFGIALIVIGSRQKKLSKHRRKR